MSQQKFQLTHCDTPVYTCYSKQASSDFLTWQMCFCSFQMQGQMMLLLLATMATREYPQLESMSDLEDMMKDLLAGNY